MTPFRGLIPSVYTNGDWLQMECTPCYSNYNWLHSYRAKNEMGQPRGLPLQYLKNTRSLQTCLSSSGHILWPALDSAWHGNAGHFESGSFPSGSLLSEDPPRSCFSCIVKRSIQKWVNWNHSLYFKEVPQCTTPKVSTCARTLIIDVSVLALP